LEGAFLSGVHEFLLQSMSMFQILLQTNITTSNMTATNINGTIRTVSQPDITLLVLLTSLTLSGAISGLPL
jgi:hypothetical protein